MPGGGGSIPGKGGVSNSGGSQSTGGIGAAAGSALPGGTLGDAGATDTAGATGSGGATTLPIDACDGGVCPTARLDAGESCPGVTACGGDVVGAWVVVSSCLNVTGERDIGNLGLGCRYAPVTGALRVTGTWTATSDGRFSDNTLTSGDEQITLGTNCVGMSGTVVRCPSVNRAFEALGYASAGCLEGQTHLDYCRCRVSVEQEGGMGLVAYGPPASGEYTTSGEVLTTNSGTEYSYCVSGNTLTFTPVSTSPLVTGTIVLRKQ